MDPEDTYGQMTAHVLRHVIPAAYALLPPKMASLEASAMLLAIGLQESRFEHRAQLHGPARGFWQFEIAGVQGVLTHDRSNGYIASALMVLRYDHGAPAFMIQPALEDNDTLAACFARCLLWTSPDAMPGSSDPEAAWRLYLSLWRPGKPRRETWATYYAQAWHRVLDGRAIPPDLRKA